MQKSTPIFLMVILLACVEVNSISTFLGFWEGPHPEDSNKKFYIYIENRNDSLTANGYWTENNFYQSRFKVDSVNTLDDSISFNVPMWDCNFSGVLVEKELVYGGFKCQGEPFDSVTLVKNKWIDDYLFNAKPDCKNPDFQYSYTIPVSQNDAIETSGFQTSNDSLFIQYLVSEIIGGEYGRLNSFLLLKNDKLICEEYFYGYSQTDLHQIESCTKSVTSLLVGIAIDKGLITDLNEPLYQIFPEYAHLKTNPYKYITIKHLLTMNSGFELQNNSLFQVDDRIDFALQRKLVYEPGTMFQYDGRNTEILGEILQRKTAMYPDDFARKYLFEPLKTGDFIWTGFEQKRSPLMSGSLCLLPRDMIKIGSLVLNNGSTSEKQIISKKWIEESTSVKTKTHIPGDDYSYQWWNLNLKSNGKGYKTIWANGWGSQFIYVIPEINVVIVTTGHNYENDSWTITDGISKYLYLLDSN